MPDNQNPLIPPPVSQSELYRRGKSLLPGVVSARRGLASALADIERGPDQAKVLHNLQAWRKRYVWSSGGIGYVNDNSTALNSGAKVLGFGKFVDSSGVTWLLAKAGSKLVSYNLSTHAATDILTGLGTTQKPCMRVYSPSTTTAQPITIFCDGNSQPQKVTATNAASALAFNSPGTWPGTFNTKTYQKPKFCEPFSDRMVYAGFSDLASSYDILISNQGDAQVFTQASPILATDACSFTVPAGLGPITGLKAFRPSNLSNHQILLVGQQYGITMISGTDTTNYSMAILTNQYGIVNNNCWAEVTDDLLFLTTKGVANLGALVQLLTRPADMLSKYINDKIANIDFTNAADAFCVHHAQTQEVQFWVPWTTDSGVVQRGMILNYNTEGGLTPEGVAWSTKDGLTPSCGIDFQGQMICGDYSGFVQLHYNGDTYNGAQIPFQYNSALITTGNLQQAGRMKEIAIATDGQGQKCSINAYATCKLADGSSRREVCSPSAYVLQDAAASITELPFTLGTSSFPGDFVKLLTKYSPIGRGYAWEIELNSGSTNDGVLDFSAALYTLSIGGIVRI